MCDQKEKDKYPVFQIKTYDKIEQLGTKEKFWFYSENDKTGTGSVEWESY